MPPVVRRNNGGHPSRVRRRNSPRAYPPQDRPGAGDRPAPPRSAPGLWGRGGHDRPGHRDGPAAIAPPHRQDRQACAPRRGLEGQGPWGALPRRHAPAPPRHTAGRHSERAPGGPTGGGSLVAPRAPRLGHGRCLAAPPRRQARADGGACPSAGPPHTETPESQDRGWRLPHMGPMGLHHGGPCGHTGVARPPYPPGGEGSHAPSPPMPHRGQSCHLVEAGVLSFFQNLLQKGTEGGALRKVGADDLAARFAIAPLAPPGLHQPRPPGVGLPAPSTSTGGRAGR